MVTFVNTTNEAQVFATSETFEIADGEGSYSKNQRETNGVS